MTTPLQAARAKRLREQAAFKWRMAHEHPTGSRWYVTYLREHGDLIHKAQRLEAGLDTALAVDAATMITVDGEAPVSLGQFILDNATEDGEPLEGDDLKAVMEALRNGQMYEGGGGAAARWTISLADSED